MQGACAVPVVWASGGQAAGPCSAPQVTAPNPPTGYRQQVEDCAWKVLNLSVTSCYGFVFWQSICPGKLCAIPAKHLPKAVDDLESHLDSGRTEDSPGLCTVHRRMTLEAGCHTVDLGCFVLRFISQLGHIQPSLVTQ